MTPEKIINDLANASNAFSANNEERQRIIEKAEAFNPWFTKANIEYTLDYWAQKLTKAHLEEWVKRENITENTAPKTVALIAAGNIPLVGLHDLLCVLITGNNALVKLSGDDEVLMSWFIEKLAQQDSAYTEKIKFAGNKMENFDAVIATGSNNTSRYFDYYFGKYPNIIRKNRNSIAVLSGNESPEQLHGLGFDITSYFGKGCRNVTQLWLPKTYDIAEVFRGIEGYKTVIEHHKYANNYTYHKAIFLMNMTPHLDNGFITVVEDRKIYSPIGVLNYAYYDSISEVEQFISENREEIQCVVASGLEGTVPFGQTQNPELWDYADGVNTVQFLKAL